MLITQESKDQHKNRLILKPAITIVLSFALIALVLFSIPLIFEHQLGKINISNNQLNVNIPEFPFFLYILLLLIITLPLIGKLINNVAIYLKWKNGESPSFPDCGAPMKQRVARQGQFVGQKFWGCSTYPLCAGKEHIGW